MYIFVVPGFKSPKKSAMNTNGGNTTNTFKQTKSKIPMTDNPICTYRQLTLVDYYPL